LNVLEVSHDTIEDVYVSLQRIAQAGGTRSGLRDLIASMKRDLSTSACARRPSPKPK
jgi:hypothetical protein